MYRQTKSRFPSKKQRNFPYTPLAKLIYLDPVKGCLCTTCKGTFLTFTQQMIFIGIPYTQEKQILFSTYSAYVWGIENNYIRYLKSILIYEIRNKIFRYCFQFNCVCVEKISIYVCRTKL